MEKNVAIKIMQFLDGVATTGHKARMEMNTCVDALVQIANQTDKKIVDGGRAKPPARKPKTTKEK
jgi:hypothetical protein